MPGFTAHRHAVLAVPRPDCHAAAGAWCRRLSGHRAADLHRARSAAADRPFVSQHGSDAEIRQDPGTGRGEIEGVRDRIGGQP